MFREVPEVARYDLFILLYQLRAMKFHMFRVYQFDENDRGQEAVIKAKNIDDAVDYVKKTYLTDEGRKEVDEDGDENGIYLTMFTEATDDDDEGYSYGFEILQDDDTEPEFHTIYGGNDFVDLINPENSGKSTAKVIKEHGGQMKAFYKHSGSGFENGNPDNDYNLNTSNLKLYVPKGETK